MPKGNQSLLLELRSEWMFMPEMAEQMLPVVLQLLNGTALDPREELIIQGFQMEGQLVNGIRAVYGANADSEDPFESFPENSVAVVPCKGTMLKYGTMCAWGADELTAIVELAYRSPKIAGVIIDTDSGGGAVSSIPVWSATLAKRNKPVMVYADVMCSAAYYMGIHADYLMLSNDLSSMVGSIGVMVSWPDYTEALAQRGIKMHTVYADQSTHKNAEFQAANGEKPDYKLLKTNMLNPLAIRFQEDVKAARPKLDQSVEGILAGKVFYAPDALKHGLVDSIGTMDQAVAKLMEMASNWQARATAKEFVTQYNSLNNHV